MTLNATVKMLSAGVALLTVFVGAGAAVDSRYAKAADVSRALTDIHRGLQDLQLGQLQTARALLSRELFDYENRDHRLTVRERQRAQMVREEIEALDRRIEALKTRQDAR